MSRRRGISLMSISRRGRKAVTRKGKRRIKMRSYVDIVL